MNKHLSLVGDDPVFFEGEIPSKTIEKEMEQSLRVLPTVLDSAKEAPIIKKEAEISGPRARISLNGQWWWWKVPGDKIGMINWQPKRIPHLWSTRTDNTSYYACRFRLPEISDSQRVRLHFESVTLYARVFVNGKYVGQHAGCYAPFDLDITEAVKPGQLNSLVVFVANLLYAVGANGELYYPVGVSSVYNQGARRKRKWYGGISGRVWVDILPELRINNVFIQTSTSKQSLEVEWEIINEGKAPKDVILIPTIEPSTTLSWPELIATVPVGKIVSIHASLMWKGARLWNPDDPFLYYLITKVKSGNQVVDVARTRFGFREFRVEGKRFMLNDRPIRLFGTSLEGQEYSEALMYDRDCIRRLYEIFKKRCGFNSLRVHRSPGTEILYEIADEVGLMMICQSGIFSGGRAAYRKGGKRFLFNATAELSEYVRAWRNHPSIIIWDTENEMLRQASGPTTQNGRDEQVFWLKLDDAIRQYDNTRPIEHSGATAFGPEAQIWHTHMQDHYTKLMELWQRYGDRPLFLGEWWIGWRAYLGGPNSNHITITSGLPVENDPSAAGIQETARLIRERGEHQRSYGVSANQIFRHPVWAIMGCKSRSGGGSGIDFVEEVREIDSRRLEHLPKTANLILDACQHIYSPVAVVFRHRKFAFYEGEEIQPPIFLANDSGEDLRLEVNIRITSLNKELIVDNFTKFSPHYSVEPLKWSFRAPKDVKQAVSLQLVITVRSNGEVIAANEHTYWIFPKHRLAKAFGRRNLWIFDPVGKTVSNLEGLGFKIDRQISSLSNLPSNIGLVVGEGVIEVSDDEKAEKLNRFVESGGQLLVLDQVIHGTGKTVPEFGLFQKKTQLAHGQISFSTGDRLTEYYFRNIPGYPGPVNRITHYSNYMPILNANHPVLQDLPCRVPGLLGWWRSGDGRVAEDYIQLPTSIDKMGNITLSHSKNIEVLVGGPFAWRVGMVEVTQGKGRAIYCQLNLLDNVPVDPIATEILNRLIHYICKIGKFS